MLLRNWTFRALFERLFGPVSTYGLLQIGPERDLCGLCEYNLRLTPGHGLSHFRVTPVPFEY